MLRIDNAKPMVRIRYLDSIVCGHGLNAGQLNCISGEIIMFGGHIELFASHYESMYSNLSHTGTVTLMMRSSSTPKEDVCEYYYYLFIYTLIPTNPARNPMAALYF